MSGRETAQLHSAVMPAAVASDAGGRLPDPAEAHMSALVESHSYAIASATLDGIVQSWNPGAEALFGYSAEEMLGGNLGLLVNELDRTLVELPNRVRHGLVECEVELRHKDGVAVTVAVSASPVRTGDAVLSMSLIMRDMSARKALERRVQSLSQLEALARVAAGIAHDINNVLTVVRTYTGFVAQAPLTIDQQRDLQVASEAATRGAALVTQLLALSHDRGAQTVVVMLGEVARGIDDMLRRTLGNGVVLTLQVPPTPLPVRAVVGQIDQMLLTLATNARDAMPEGGRLSIDVQRCQVDPEHELSQELVPGAHALISVKDTGVGMDEATRARAFEPFFTTKQRTESTGLGLLIVQEIVKQLRGAIRVSSAPKQGSEFKVYLPLYEVRSRATSLPPNEGGQARKKTVLVVDDDIPIRNALRRILQAEGYNVLEAADGFEATETAANHPGMIDLLLCDLLMPRVGGRSTVARIRESRPNVRVVYVSGQPGAEDAAAEGAGFVQKPFTREELITTVKHGLERPQARTLRPLPPRPVVLVVDDSTEFRESLVRLLEESALITLTAKSGLHALQILESQHVDLVLSDQYMQGIDGVRLLELVLGRWPQCQRVLFTGHASSDVVLDAVNRGGAHRVLVKSMHPVAIRDQIEAAALSAHRFRETSAV